MGKRKRNKKGFMSLMKIEEHWIRSKNDRDCNLPNKRVYWINRKYGTTISNKIM